MKKTFELEAIVATWNPGWGDYDEVMLDTRVRAETAEEAEEIARDRWFEHGYNPDRVKCRELAC